MKLKFTIHCQIRILERGINIEHIKKVILKPDKKKNAGDGATKAWKKIGSKELVVIYSRDGFRDRKNEYFIITAYYL